MALTPLSFAESPSPAGERGFSESARALAGFAGAVLQWTPDVFWASTPEELATMFAVLVPEVPERVDLGALMERFPDG